MVGHQTVRMDGDPETFVSEAEQAFELDTIAISKKDGLTRNAAIDDVMPSAGGVETRTATHPFTLANGCHTDGWCLAPTVSRVGQRANRSASPPDAAGSSASPSGTNAP